MGRAGFQAPTHPRLRGHMYIHYMGPLGPHLILTQELKQLSSLLSVAGSLSFELDSRSLVLIKLQGQEAEPEL